MALECAHLVYSRLNTHKEDKVWLQIGAWIHNELQITAEFFQKDDGWQGELSGHKGAALYCTRRQSLATPCLSSFRLPVAVVYNIYGIGCLLEDFLVKLTVVWMLD